MFQVFVSALRDIDLLLKENCSEKNKFSQPNGWPRKENETKKIILTSAVAAIGISPAAFAAGDSSRAYIQPVTIETGHAQKLHMVNVGQIKHEVSPNELTGRIFTRKIEIADADGE
ncbi:MAG: hypothetical protein ACWA49_08085 [Ruegeria sp.]